MVKALEHGHYEETATLDLFNHLIPSRHGVNVECVPNPIFDLRLVPLFMIERFVITFDPNGPKHNAPKEVPNFNHFAIFVGNPFPKQCFLPVEAIIISSSNPRSSCILNVAHLHALLG